MARGSITRRGDSWRIAVELPPDPKTGKRRQRFETFHGTKREADKQLTTLLGLLDGQMLGANPKMTLAAYLERWLLDHASTKSPKTALRYKEIIEHYVVPHLGHKRLDRVTTADCVHLSTTLRDSVRRDGRGKLSPCSLRHVYRALHVAFNCAVKWGLLVRNPLDGVEPPKVPAKEMKTFTVGQAQAFLASAAEEGLNWECFFSIAITTGLRQAELRGLRWQDIDLDSGTIHVQQTIQRVRGAGRIVLPTKTASGRRPVAIDPDVVSLLRVHKTQQKADRLKMGPLWQEQGLVFPSQVGTPLEDKRMRDVFFRTCERAGVPRIRPYDLRHSCASLLLAAGVHPKVVAERLGHSSINLTLTTYSHVLPTLQKDAAETLGRLLKTST